MVVIASPGECQSFLTSDAAKRGGLEASPPAAFVLGRCLKCRRGTLPGGLPRLWRAHRRGSERPAARKSPHKYHSCQERARRRPQEARKAGCGYARPSAGGRAVPRVRCSIAVQNGGCPGHAASGRHRVTDSPTSSNPASVPLSVVTKTVRGEFGSSICMESGAASDTLTALLEFPWDSNGFYSSLTGCPRHVSVMQLTTTRHCMPRSDGPSRHPRHRRRAASGTMPCNIPRRRGLHHRFRLREVMRKVG